MEIIFFFFFFLRLFHLHEPWRHLSTGLFADNLLMDIVADKQLSTQFSMQSECDTHLSHSEHEEESEKDRNESDSEGDEEEERESSRMRSPSNICGIVEIVDCGFFSPSFCRVCQKGKMSQWIFNNFITKSSQLTRYFFQPG